MERYQKLDFLFIYRRWLVLCYWLLHKLVFLFLQIETIELPQDPKTEKRRGFVFITYKEESALKKAMEKKYHTVGESKVNTLHYLSHK